MAIPATGEFRVPILLEVARAGGRLSTSRQETGKRILDHFPPGFMTAADLGTVAGSKKQQEGDPKWWNQIRGCVKQLKEKRLLEPRNDKIWAITDSGRPYWMDN